MKNYNKKITIVCPDCGIPRLVEVWCTKTRTFTGRCSSCNGIFQGRKIGKCTPRRGTDSPRWKGGRYKNQAGYIFVTLTPEDEFFYPMMHRSANRVMEHRLVMAKYLGRCLLPWEVVHHKNGVKDDNRLDNLELLSDKRWHLIDNKTKGYIGALEREIKRLHKIINRLEGRND